MKFSVCLLLRCSPSSEVRGQGRTHSQLRAGAAAVKSLSGMNTTGNWPLGIQMEDGLAHREAIRPPC